MISIRPDIRSYSRISYLREIHGDPEGAIEAMKLAVDAGQPGAEGTEWARVQLGKLYEQTGELKYAEMNYAISLQNRPNYPYALAGLARLAVAAKDFGKQLDYIQQPIHQAMTIHSRNHWLTFIGKPEKFQKQTQSPTI
jgi:tetratricopeptide (TPR) repeat protein